MDNWCEYVSEGGEVKHVLQVFCECEDLDETFTELLSPSTEGRDGGSAVHRIGPRSRWQRVLDVTQDRARVPWPGGARRVDLAWFAAAFLLNLLRWQIQRSQTLAAVGLSLAACFSGLAYSHVHALRQRSRSRFHVAWLILSIVQSYRKYIETTRHSLPSATDATAHVALLSMLACYFHCCVADPGRDEVADASAPEAADVIAAEGTGRPTARDGLHRSERLRSGRCSICRCTFRLRDHHCLWVGQCVAERNRRSFLLFLFLLSGLSLWFGSNMLALAADEADTCHVDATGHLPPPQVGGALCLLLRNVGGEDVGYALYVITAGVLAVALTAQQCLLVGAGLTTLELRRSRVPARRDKPRSADGSRPLLSYHPRDPHGSSARTSRHRVTLFPPAREFFGNWNRFLSGTELPRMPPDLSSPGNCPTVAERVRRRDSCADKAS